MYAAISDFFRSTFSESLTRLIQTNYIVVSAIFLFLNTLFIFPDMFTHDVSLIINLQTLNPILQIALVVAVVLVQAYLLASLSSSILRFITGESWNNSLLSDICKKLQLREKRELQKNERDLEAKYQILRRFPQKDSQIGPTALGNALNATASYIYENHGMDLVSLWPLMEIVIAKNDMELKTRIDNEQSALDFLLGLAFVLGLFAVEHFLVEFCWLQRNVAVLWGPSIFLVLAFTVYRAAVIKAGTWGDTVRVAVNLHKYDLQTQLQTQLQLREVSNQKDGMYVWREASKQILWGEGADNIFKIPPSSVPSITCSSNAKATLEYNVTTLRKPQAVTRVVTLEKETQPTKVIEYPYESIDYTLFISGVETNANAARGIYILVSDPRAPRIGTPPIADMKNGVQVKARVITTNEEGRADQLLWSIDYLASDSAMILRYCIHSKIVEIRTKQIDLNIEQIDEPDNEEQEPKWEEKSIDYGFTLTNIRVDGSDINNASFDVFDSRRPFREDVKGGSASYTLNGQDEEFEPELEKLPSERRYRWTVEKVMKTSPIELHYTL